MTAALVDGLPGLDWMVGAACRGADPEQFFPHLQSAGPGRGADVRPAAVTAWRWCQPCPVIARCHAHAEANPGTVGIYGGCLRWQESSGAARSDVQWLPLVPAAPVREAS